VSGNNDEPNALPKLVLVPANNFSQTAPNTIANDRAAETARSNESRTPRILFRNHTQNQEFAALRDALAFHTLVF